MGLKNNQASSHDRMIQPASYLWTACYRKKRFPGTSSAHTHVFWSEIRKPPACTGSTNPTATK